MSLIVPRLVQEISGAQEALIVKKTLEERWTKQHGGFVKILANQAHLWEEIRTVSDSPYLFIIPQGEQPRGAFEESDHIDRVNRNWMVVVMRGHGFKNVMAEDVGNALAFIISMESIRDIIRSILNISQEFPVHYGGMIPLPSIAPNTSANVFLDGMAIEYSTAHDIPQISTSGPQMTSPTQQMP